MIDFLQYLLDGLATGSVYALIAVGYSMVFGVLQLVNFAHSELFMLGAYMVMLLFLQGAPIWAALLLAGCGVGLFAVLMERFAYRPLRHSGRLAPLITAVGISIFLQNLVQAVFSPNPQAYPFHLPSGILEFGEDILVRQRDIIIFALAIVLTLGLEAFVRYTKPGKGIRAVAIHPQAARIVGVPYNRIVSLTFFIGAAMAVVAGALQGAATNQIWPYMGVSSGLKAFAAAVLGGIGNLPGALVGGLTLGIVESLLVGYDFSTFKDGAAFLILILVLLVRPQGILGKKALVKV
jgi:branched-chain amino acid transport system permease protein